MKTSKYIRLLTISAFLMVFATSTSASDELPSDSKALVDKLEAFVAEEEAKAAKTIEEKKKAVVALLNKHLERETKAGNLDSALSLKNKIAELSGTGVELEDTIDEKAGLKNEFAGKKRIPADAVERSGHFYKVYEAPPKSWLQAQSKCEELGGNLAIINTSSELRFLARLASDYSIVWLGASGNFEEGWKWVDGTEFKDGPELKKGDNKGLLLNSGKIGYEFHRVIGNFTKGYICEWTK